MAAPDEDEELRRLAAAADVSAAQRQLLAALRGEQWAEAQALGRLLRPQLPEGGPEEPLQAAALQFPFGHPAVATVIPGARSPA